MDRTNDAASRLWVRWFFSGALAAVLATTASVQAQSLMVGPDGSVHLDEFSGSSLDDPVIVNVAPQLVPPAGAQPLAGPMMGGGMPMMAPGQPVMTYPAPMAGFVPVAQQARPSQPSHSIFGEFLFLHPTGADVAHAQQQNDAGGAGATPFGQIGAPDLHYEPGVRVGGDWAVGETASLAGTYTYFESNARSRVEPPTIAGGAGSVGSLVHHPAAGIGSPTGQVDARSVLDFQMADADYRALLLADNRFWINGSVGLRGGHLEQNFGQLGTFAGAPPGVIATQTEIDFDGGGPKFGIDGGRALGTRGLSVYAHAGVSPLAGQFRSSYLMTNQTAGATLAQADWNDDRITTVLDYEVGFAWTGPRRRWRVAAGYTTLHWFNAVTTPGFISAVQQDAYGDVSDTISFDGLTTRIEHIW